MANKKKFNKKGFSRKNRISAKRKAAYWIGVGISVSRDRETRMKLLESTSVSSSVIAGYNADNYRDVGGSFARNNAKKR